MFRGGEDARVGGYDLSSGCGLRGMSRRQSEARTKTAIEIKTQRTGLRFRKGGNEGGMER